MKIHEIPEGEYPIKELENMDLFKQMPVRINTFNWKRKISFPFVVESDVGLIAVPLIHHELVNNLPLEVRCSKDISGKLFPEERIEIKVFPKKGKAYYLLNEEKLSDEIALGFYEKFVAADVSNGTIKYYYKKQ